MATPSGSQENPSDDVETQLFLSYLGGDRAAFDKLERRVRARARGVARKILGDHHDAQDAVQTTWDKVLEKPELFDGKRAFLPWFLTIVGNTAKDARRTKQRQAEREEKRRERSPSWVEVREDRSDEIHYAWAALKALDTRDRATILHVFFNGYGYDEGRELVGGSKARARHALAAAKGRTAAEMARIKTADMHYFQFDVGV